MTDGNITISVVPRLIVDDADAALQVYGDVFGAEQIEYFAMPDGRVVHTAVRIGTSEVWLTEDEVPQTSSVPVLLHVTVPDPDAACERLVAAGGEVLIPIEDRFYGRREGRVRDPFGHVWILSRPIEDLSDDEIRRRLAG